MHIYGESLVTFVKLDKIQAGIVKAKEIKIKAGSENVLSTSLLL